MLPIVPPGSSTALRAQESVDDRSSASAYAWLFVGSMAVGTAVALAPLFLQDPNDSSVPVVPLAIGLGILTIGGLWGGIAMMLKGQSAEDAAADAFATYEEDLRGYLNLCATAGQVHACEMSVSPTTTGDCVPDCRAGFVCVQGTCRSACNPPCEGDQSCVVEASGPACR